MRHIFFAIDDKQFKYAMALIATVLAFCVIVFITTHQDPVQSVPHKDYPPYDIVKGHHFVKK